NNGIVLLNRVFQLMREGRMRRAQSSCEASGHPWHQPNDLPRWQGDVDAVAEILANLIENALRYAPPQAPIGFCWSTSAEAVQLLLWDGGRPIPEPERERIFCQGQRGTTGAGHQGTGYGLSLGRQLALSLGGALTLITQPRLLCSEATPEGNGFLLTLPTSP
ncbi:MAG: sensor histidine kinase, partial [Cyanobacteria bacterium MAG IRC1_bin_28]|nr:sensor histidine kinase [Cyanobacteria bacterium MAG IRC1_bin_28]